MIKMKVESNFDIRSTGYDRFNIDFVSELMIGFKTKQVKITLPLVHYPFRAELIITEFKDSYTIKFQDEIIKTIYRTERGIKQLSDNMRLD